MKTALLAILALLPACTQAKAPPPPAPVAAKPALWQVRDPDTVIYLFGTIHALPDGVRWESPRIAAAVAKSDALVLEVGNLGDAAAIAKAFQSVALSPGLPPVLDRVAPAKRAALTAALAEAKLPIAAADRIETWAVALVVVAAAVQRLGYSRDNGVEATLRAKFDAKRKPTSGLETAEQQFGYFDTLTEASQRTLLEAALDDDANAKKQFDAMLGAWKRGDVAKIALTFDDELKLSPELTTALLDKRNAAWATWIKARLAKPGTVFVAVGAGHLAGKGSVEALLAAKGLKVTRLQ